MIAARRLAGFTTASRCADVAFVDAIIRSVARLMGVYRRLHYRGANGQGEVKIARGARLPLRQALARPVLKIFSFPTVESYLDRTAELLTDEFETAIFGGRIPQSTLNQIVAGGAALLLAKQCEGEGPVTHLGFGAIGVSTCVRK